MDSFNDVSSPMSFASSSYVSNVSDYHHLSTSGAAAGLELLSLSKLSANLHKLVLSKEYDYTDAEIQVEGVIVGVHRCILAARSPFFHKLFKDGNGNCEKDSKPKYLISNLVHQGSIGYEAFMVVLNYLYTGKVMASPCEVSTCVEKFCAHDSCGIAINYAVELMYASAACQITELVMLVKRRLHYYVDKAFAEDVIPIAAVAFHCELKELLSHCVQKIVESDLDDVIINKELPREVSINIKSLRNNSKREEEQNSMQVDSLNEKRIQKIHQALDSDDVTLVKLLLEEPNISLDSAHALHYAAAYCNPKIFTEVLNLGNADINLKNSRGHTVLHVAARRKDISIIVALLEHGASVSDTTKDGQTAVTICRRLTRSKDYLTMTKHGEETNKDKLCINVLEREMERNPLAGNMSVSPMMVVAIDLYMRLLLCENRVAMARRLFPLEASLAMQLARADSTSEFAGLSNLDEIPSEKIRSLEQRLQALEKTVETGRRYFPNCSEVLDKLSEDDNLGDLLLEKGSLEEQKMKLKRYQEIQNEMMKAINKDMGMAVNSLGDLPSTPSTAKGNATKRKSRRR